ncbi:HNH endonuclease [Paracoccus bogoriensis]|uniref:HNH endonuclease n=1 Tax=Paracoccus bogoriensis TaxID=242065 RepID=UPI001CA4F449|nr:HNH endonuclease [Paracoccus bogoriensis]MBW7057827.1 HNH endonuclease [Paracoccus bogoriensis]
MIEAPQSFVVATECDKAARDNGFRRVLGEREGWAGFASTTVPGTVHLAAQGPGGPWYLALDHAGVIAALGLAPAPLPGPGLARFRFDSLTPLYQVLRRVYELAASLPDAPLVQFEARTRALPQTTEAERLTVQRIGQEIFRAALMDYWQGRCPLTGIAEPALLRASHIVPWAACESDAQRLDVHNGLLLSALWDAAFDRGLVSFADDGTPMFAPGLSGAARAALVWQAPLPLTDAHRRHLAWHRAQLFGKAAEGAA